MIWFLDLFFQNIEAFAYSLWETSSDLLACLKIGAGQTCTRLIVGSHLDTSFLIFGQELMELIRVKLQIYCNL